MTAQRTPPPTKTPAPSTPGWASEPRLRRVRGFLLGQLAARLASPIVNLIAAFLLGTACVFLVAAWQMAPQRIVAAESLKKLTGHARGTIVDSWLALELDPAAVGTHSRWQTFGLASHCMVVEYAGAWSVPIRRAFCGTRFPFDETFVTPDLGEMAPRVPFTWRRDARGFLEPEIRLGPAALDWLLSHPASFAWPNQPPPPSALAALRLALDRPVDHVVVGWSLPIPAFPLVFDPRHPEGALPAGYVARQLDNLPAAGNWVGFVVIALLGLAVWFETMGFVLGRMPRWAFWFVATVPLLTVPWWGDEAPRAIRHFNKDWGDVVETMLADLGRLDRLVACDPAGATLARGERLTWRTGEEGHVDTFWRFVPRSATGKVQVGVDPGTGGTDAEKAAAKQALAERSDAVLAKLTESVTAQVRDLGEGDRIALFTRLERDKKGEALHSGLVFLPAAKEAILDPESPPALRRAARDFLWIWVLQPDDGMSSKEAMGERLRLERELMDLPIPEIANMASAHWDPARKPS